MYLNTKFRTDAAEIMDDFTLEGEILRDALDKIAKINKATKISIRVNPAVFFT